MIDQPALRVRTSSATGTTHVVSAEGEIDVATREAFAAAVDPGRPVEAVVVDLTEVRFIDSSGFRVIHTASNARRVLVVVPPTSFVARAVAVSGLGEVVELYATLDEALASTGDPGGPAAPGGPYQA